MKTGDRIMVYILATLVVGLLGWIGYELSEIVARLDLVQHNLFQLRG